MVSGCLAIISKRLIPYFFQLSTTSSDFCLCLWFHGRFYFPFNVQFARSFSLKVIYFFFLWSHAWNRIIILIFLAHSYLIIQRRVKGNFLIILVINFNFKMGIFEKFWNLCCRLFHFIGISFYIWILDWYFFIFFFLLLYFLGWLLDGFILLL